MYPLLNPLTFPLLHVPDAEPTFAEVVLWQERPLLCILAVLNVSIHALLNNAFVRWQVRQLWRGWCEVRRGLRDDKEEVWEAWLQWCREMGCPV